MVIAEFSAYSVGIVVVAFAVVFIYDLYRMLFKDRREVSEHRAEHLMIFAFMSSGYTWFMWTFLFHEGLAHSISIHLGKENGAYGILIFNASLLMLLKHTYKELDNV